MLAGYRTYIAIVLTLLGSFGVFEQIGVSKEEVAKFIDDVLVVVAGATALYLNWENHKKIK